MKIAASILIAALLALPAQATTYTTAFPHPPAAENPISESSNWSVPSQHGNSTLWGDIQTAAGGSQAYGVSEPTQFGDPTALNTGSWGANQTVQATVVITNTGIQTGTCCHEVEVRVRMVDTASSITGYEIYCSIMTNDQYCHIARWNGGNGDYCNLNPTIPSINLNNGDVLKGTVTGNSTPVLTLFVNGVQEVQVTDSGQSTSDCPGGAHAPFLTGNPGMGFYDNQENLWSEFGFSAYTATDGVSSITSAPARNLFVINPLILFEELMEEMANV